MAGVRFEDAVLIRLLRKEDANRERRRRPMRKKEVDVPSSELMQDTQ